MATNSLSSMYPSMALLAQAIGSDLDGLAVAPSATIDLLGLQASCWWVASSQPRQDSAADPYGYLKTFDDLLMRFPAPDLDRKKFWDKLNHPAGSSYLDTVGEAAMALQLADQPGRLLQLEVPFQLASGTRKDADLVTAQDAAATKFWIDVVSIRPDDITSVHGAYDPHAVARELVALLAKRVKRKYESKFKQAVIDRAITDPVGVCVCVLKCEEIIAPITPLLTMGLAPDLSAPPNLWTDCPGLAIAHIHTVAKRAGSDRLFPSKFVTWTRP
jgi:hypothetical protein